MTVPTVFEDLVTLITSDWLNPVSHLTYDVFSYPYNESGPKDLVNGVPARTPAEARNAIHACDQSPGDGQLWGRRNRAWEVLALAGNFPEAPIDGLSYARQNTGVPDSYGNPNQWTRSQRVYVQATDPAA